MATVRRSLTRSVFEFLLRRYPRRWRERYEAEVTALLDGRMPTWPEVFDLARGCVAEHAIWWARLLARLFTSEGRAVLAATTWGRWICQIGSAVVIAVAAVYVVRALVVPLVDSGIRPSRDLVRWTGLAVIPSLIAISVITNRSLTIGSVQGVLWLVLLTVIALLDQLEFAQRVGSNPLRLHLTPAVVAITTVGQLLFDNLWYHRVVGRSMFKPRQGRQGLFQDR